MISRDFLNEIDDVYAIIINRFKLVESYYISKGYTNHNVTFEDVDLDDLLESRLVPLFIPIFNRYPYPYTSKKEMNTILVATLCEIAKRGLSQRGIIKTLDKYLGVEVDRNKYYRIIPNVLREEGVDVVLKTGKKYENAIISEAGIPRNMHSIVMTFFSVYWKWFKHIDEDIRHRELESFLLSGEFMDEFILDTEDYRRLKESAKHIEANNVSAKAIKTSIRLESVFAELDRYDGIVTEHNVNEVCDQISLSLGYNILTLVNEKELKKEVLSYANKVSFKKFDKILNNLSSNELIRTPAGTTVARRNLAQKDLMCGYYIVRGVIYEVTYSFPIGVIDLICLEQNKIHNWNGWSIYVAKQPFIVEIDNWEQPIRRLCYEDNYLYIYAGKIGAAAIAYIDDLPVNSLQDTKFLCGIKRRWDYECECNVLGVSVYNLSYYNPKYKMKSVELRVGKHVLRKRINTHGFVQMLDQWFEIDGNETEILVQARIEGEIILEKKLFLPEHILLGKYTGLKIDKYLDLKNWYGRGDVVFFTIDKVSKTNNVTMNHISKFGRYYVYDGEVDLRQEYFTIDENRYEIKRTTEPFLTLNCPYEYVNQKYVVKKLQEAEVKINNCNSQDGLFLIKIVHTDRDDRISLSINGECTVNFSEYFEDKAEYTGKWEVMLIKDQRIIDRINFVVLPVFSIINKSGIVKRGENCEFIINSNVDCFRNGELFLNEKSIAIDTARIAGEISNCKNDIQENVYIDTCDIYYPITVPINIWDAYIEKREQRIEGSSINFEELNDINLIIESNFQNRLNVVANGKETFIETIVGKKLVSIKDFFQFFKYHNDIRIIGGRGEYKLDVLYIPKVKLLQGYESTNDEISFYIKYTGPTDIIIGIEIFEHYLRLYRNEIKAVDNTSLYKVKINDCGKTDRHFTVEVDFNGKSKRSIGEIYIEKRSCSQEISLSDYKLLFSVLETKNEECKLTTNLYEILGIGGKPHEI